MTARILIADDELATAERIAGILRDARLGDVDVLPRVANMQQLQGYDLVILDVVWPARAAPIGGAGEFGFAALDYLRKNAPACKVALMSKYTFDMTELERIRNADGFFVSTADATTVVETLRQLQRKPPPGTFLESSPSFVRQRQGPSRMATVFDLLQIVTLALRTDRAEMLGMSEADRGVALTIVERLDAEMLGGRLDWMTLSSGIGALTKLTARADNLQRVLAEARECLGAVGADSKKRLFVSYCRADSEWLKLLQTHLAPYEYRQALSVWDDRQIVEGKPWEPQILAALETADVIVALVTPKYLASSFIQTVEIPCILELARRDRARLFWVAVASAAWETAGLDKIGAANDPKKPLSAMSESERDEILVSICRRIAKP